MAIVTITEQNFSQEVLTSKRKVLLDFWATWCGPCRMLSPTLEKVAEDHPEIKVGKVNVDEQPTLAQKYNVMSIPTLLVFENGALKQQSVGLISKEQVEALLG